MIDDFINSILKNEKSPMDFNDLFICTRLF